MPTQTVRNQPGLVHCPVSSPRSPGDCQDGTRLPRWARKQIKCERMCGGDLMTTQVSVLIINPFCRLEKNLSLCYVFDK